MLTPIANFHRSLLPQPGQIGSIIMGHDRFTGPLYWDGRRRRCIVEGYPLSDGADYRYSYGVHTCWVRFLDNGERRRFSGVYFVAEEN